MKMRYRLMVAWTLAAAALVQPGAADACTVMSISKPQELVEQATAIIHVKMRGPCSELTGPCAQLSVPPTPPAPPRTAEPYAPGWPRVMAPPAPSSSPPAPSSYSRRAGVSYTLLAVEVVEVLKGPPVAGIFAIRGALVTRDDYNDRDPPYNFVRKEGRAGSCYARTYRQDAEYLLFLRGASDVMTPYWAPLAPVNEQVTSTHDPWITWVRDQVAAKPGR